MSIRRSGKAVGVGGLALAAVVLVTSLRIIRSADLLQGQRRTAPEEPDRAVGEQGRAGGR